MAHAHSGVSPLHHIERLAHHEISACCIAPPLGGDWSLKNLYDADDAQRDPDFTAQVLAHLKRHGTTRVLAPSVAAMSGIVVPGRKLTTAIPLGDGFTLYRNRELAADGVTLHHLEGEQCFMMSGGGCPVIIAVGDHECVVAHASRDSLIDKKKVETGEASREHEGIMHALRQHFIDQRVRTGSVDIRLLFAVKGKAFIHSLDDPEHGPKNRLLLAHLERMGMPKDVMNYEGRLSIPALVSELTRKLGFRSCRSLCELPINGSFAYTRHFDPALAKKRNLVIVRVH